MIIFSPSLFPDGKLSTSPIHQHNSSDLLSGLAVSSSSLSNFLSPGQSLSSFTHSALDNPLNMTSHMPHHMMSQPPPPHMYTTPSPPRAMPVVTSEMDTKPSHHVLSQMSISNGEAHSRGQSSIGVS